MADSALSVRLPKATRERLDRAAASQRRSRSQVVIDALEKHLREVEAAQEAPAKRRYQTLLSFPRPDRDSIPPRTPEEVLAEIRWLRGRD